LEITNLRNPTLAHCEHSFKKWNIDTRTGGGNHVVKLLIINRTTFAPYAPSELAPFASNPKTYTFIVYLQSRHL